MTNEFKHKTVGDDLDQDEWEGIGYHIFNNQAIGDILYASSSTQLSRLGIGSTNNLLTVTGGVPVWTATPSVTTLTATTATVTNLTTDTFDAGTSGSPESYTAGSPVFELYATSSNATTTNAEPFYVKSVMTGAGGYGGRSRFHAYTNVALGSNFMGLKSYAEFGSSGSCAGLASGFCSEIKMPNASVSGSYYALEVEYVAGTSTTIGGNVGSNAGFVYLANSGDADGDFDDNGWFMRVDGLTAGAGHMLSANSQTLKMNLGGSTNRYLVMSTAEDVLTTAGTITSSNTTAGLITSGAATDGISITGACTDGIHISGNCTYAIHLTGTIDSGCGIYAVNTQANACYSGIWWEIASTDTDGDFSVIRGIGTSNSASGGNQIRAIRGQAKCGASKHADLLEGGSFEVDYSAGSCDVLRACALAAHISQGSGLANCGNLYVGHLRAQTRGDESISTDDDILYLENEAVGGNGREMDCFIKCAATNMGGGTKGATYLIDGGTATSLLKTAVLRLPDDAATADADGGSTADGWIKVVIGTQATYIPTYNTAH